MTLESDRGTESEFPNRVTLMWRLVLVLATGILLVGCDGQAVPEDCDAGPAPIGYRNGRVEPDGLVACPGQCPRGTRAKRAECVWDCPKVYYCVPDADGGF